MATKQLDVIINIPPHNCSREIQNALNEIGSFKGRNKGVFTGTYTYVLQRINVQVILRNNNGRSELRLIGKSDDLIGTGAKKAINKLWEYLESVEPQYIIDYKIDEAFSATLKKDYVKGKEVLSNALSQRPDVFKVLFGLGLCFLNENNTRKGEEYILRAVDNTPKGEKRINVIRKVVSVLWSLKEYTIAQKLFKTIGDKARCDKKDRLFYILLLLNSRNYSELAVVLTKEFPQNKEFVLKLLRDPSAEKQCRNEFIKKLPGLIKAFRKKVVFNILAPNIKYLIANNSLSLPLKYRSSLERFYRSKDLNIVDFIDLYGQILKVLEGADKEAEAILKNKNKETLDSLHKNALLLNVFSENYKILPNVRELDSVTSAVNKCAEQMKSALSFNQKYNATKDCINVNIKCEELIKRYRKEFPSFIEKLILDKRTKDVERAIEVFALVYKELPKDIDYFQQEIEKIKFLENERRTQIARILLVVLGAVLLMLIVFIYLKNNSSHPSSTGNGSETKNVAPVSNEKESFTLDDFISFSKEKYGFVENDGTIGNYGDFYFDPSDGTFWFAFGLGRCGDEINLIVQANKSKTNSFDLFIPKGNRYYGRIESSNLKVGELEVISENEIYGNIEYCAELNSCCFRWGTHQSTNFVLKKNQMAHSLDIAGPDTVKIAELYEISEYPWGVNTPLLVLWGLNEKNGVVIVEEINCNGGCGCCSDKFLVYSTVTGKAIEEVQMCDGEISVYDRDESLHRKNVGSLMKKYGVLPTTMQFIPNVDGREEITMPSQEKLFVAAKIDSNASLLCESPGEFIYESAWLIGLERGRILDLASPLIMNSQCLTEGYRILGYMNAQEFDSFPHIVILAKGLRGFEGEVDISLNYIVAEIAGPKWMKDYEKTVAEVMDEGYGSVIPWPRGYINDFENILTESEEIELTQLIEKHQIQTNDQIAVAIIEDTFDWPFDDFALGIADEWMSGQLESNWILIVLGKSSRRIRIVTGDELRHRLTDTEAQWIVDEIMIPNFKNNNYFKGLQDGIEAVIVGLNE